MSTARLAIGGAVGLVILSAIFGRPHHPHFLWDSIPPFFALFGYAGTWLLVFAAKTLGKRWIERDERYYDE